MTEMGVRSLRRGELEPLADLIGRLGLTGHFSGDAVMHGNDPVIRSPHRLGAASRTTQLLIGAAGAAIWAARGGTRTDISVDIIHALHYLHQTHYVGAGWLPEQRRSRVRRGQWDLSRPATAATSCSRPGRRTRSCSPGISTSSTAVTTSSPSPARSPVERGGSRTGAGHAGLPGCRRLPRAEWLAHPQGQALRQDTADRDRQAQPTATRFPPGKMGTGRWTASGARLHARAGRPAQRPHAGRVRRRGAAHQLAVVRRHPRPAPRRRRRQSTTPTSTCAPTRTWPPCSGWPPVPTCSPPPTARR